jgi:hypothetical protein
MLRQKNFVRSGKKCGGAKIGTPNHTPQLAPALRVGEINVTKYIYM